jgi:class 3 adenylate cyclase
MQWRFRRRGPADPASGDQRRGWGISLSTRLAATVLGVGLASLVAATVVGVNAGQNLGRDIVDDSLQAQRTSGTLETVAQLRYFERLVAQLASSGQTAEVIEEFSAALPELADLPRDELFALRDELLAEYQELYFAPLAAIGESLQVDDILSNAAIPIVLQSLYSVPDEPVTDPITISDAGDGSEYSALHARFHNVYRTALLQGGLRDVLLVDDATQRIVYSVAKGPDLGTSLEVGPFSGSLVAGAVGAVEESEEPAVTDLRYYRPTPGVPLGAAAAPVFADGQRVGTVVITYDAAIYTERLTSLAEASRGGGEQDQRNLYLIGGDGRTRSDPQFYLEEPDAFLDAVQATGAITDQERSIVETTETTVLVVPASDSTVNAAVDGNTAVSNGFGMTGAEVVSAVERLEYDGLTWFTVAELGIGTAEATITNFRRVLLFGAAAFVVALAFLAVAWATKTMRPVRIISERLGREAIAKAAQSGVEPVVIPDRSPIEFHRLADSLTEMGQSLHAQQLQLRHARAERLGVMERMLPPAVAQRIERGDIEAVDEVPSATVVVVVLLGLGDLVAARRDGDRRLLDELHAELDDVALEHGLNRIKVVGDAYFGACGHDRPFIDHAPRVVAFAEAVAAVVRRLSATSPVRLATASGICTGPVMVGMSGGSRLVYDVWGPTVTTAHLLARSAHDGEILLAETTRDRLPQEIEVAQWDGSLIGQESDGAQPADQEAAVQVWTVLERPAGDGSATGGSPPGRVVPR